VLRHPVPPTAFGASAPPSSARDRLAALVRSPVRAPAARRVLIEASERGCSWKHPPRKQPPRKQPPSRAANEAIETAPLVRIAKLRSDCAPHLRRRLLRLLTCGG
jgi:hypothetical protein